MKLLGSLSNDFMLNVYLIFNLINYGCFILWLEYLQNTSAVFIWLRPLHL